MKCFLKALKAFQSSDKPNITNLLRGFCSSKVLLLLIGWGGVAALPQVDGKVQVGLPEFYAGRRTTSRSHTPSRSMHEPITEQTEIEKMMTIIKGEVSKLHAFLKDTGADKRADASLSHMLN